MGQPIGMRLDGRLSLRKGEGESEGLAGADAGNRTPHLCPLPLCEGRGEITNCRHFVEFRRDRIGLKLTINDY
jgi:hypothetical protein